MTKNNAGIGTRNSPEFKTFTTPLEILFEAVFVAIGILRTMSAI